MTTTIGESPLTNDTRAIALPRAEAARAVGLSDRELKRAIDDGELEARWRGRKCLIGLDELREWFDALPASKPGLDG